MQILWRKATVKSITVKIRQELMCYSHPGRSLTSCLHFQCVHSVYLRQLNKLKTIIKLIIALQEMKNADIKAKNSLSHEVSWYISPVGVFWGKSKHHKKSLNRSHIQSELNSWIEKVSSLGSFFNSYSKIREVEEYDLNKARKKWKNSNTKIKAKFWRN